ncbi:hypothetical protein [Phreatobacter stygius]|uniref:Uncharacterized protein n=1 Tax=Phreatobacter stygius TaxID=1940610 RepID=A0A4D7B9I6_9HYPH|nr:hypothetical protein [Phreatobacter stygius]QCI67443.1 hypothetical protein E8M01_26380 [Phreatobacter stygius]
MCDYSLEHVASRPAKVGDELISTRFALSLTRGFASCGEPDVAVCLLPGTELVFEKEVVRENILGFLFNLKISARAARFRHINENVPRAHHDALEFADGTIVLLTRLREGQRATVLQLPADQRAERFVEQPGPTETREPQAVWFLPGVP